MALNYQTVADYRHLQLVCEQQAIITNHKECRKALEEMAEEYRKMAEFLERTLSAGKLIVAPGPLSPLLYSY